MCNRSSLSYLFKLYSGLNVYNSKYSDNYMEKRNDFIHYNKALIEKSQIVNIDSDEKLPEGRFSTMFRGVKIESFLKKCDSDCLIVTFDGARTLSGGKIIREIPYFPRWSWYPFIDGNYLCIEDPMYYKYDRLKLGWFYGTKDEDYAEYISEFILIVANKLGVTQSNIILYGSSGGGTVAIRIGAILQDAKVVAINPQLSIKDWVYSDQFMEVTGIDLYSSDKYHRNDIPYLVKHAQSSRFLIIMNCESRYDVMLQLKPFCEVMGYEKLPHYGLSKYGNIYVWLYSIPSGNPHNATEHYCIFYFIRQIIDYLHDEDFLSKYEDLILYINEIWFNLTTLKEQNDMYSNTGTYWKEYSDSQNYLTKKYQKEINVANASTNFSFRILCENLQPSTLYKLRIDEVSVFTPSVNIITIALFDFGCNRFIKKINYALEDHTINLLFNTDKQTNNIKLIIYAGEVGKTMGNSLKFCHNSLEEVGKVF